MNTCHLLLTRFNIQYEPGESVGISSAWLDERLRLFEQYCLPSVMAQSSKDFIWLFFCDIRTPVDYKKRIAHYQTLVPQLRIYWLPYHDNDYFESFAAIGKEYAAGHDCLITSRMDNDDLIAPDYIARVRQAAEEGKEGIISFPKGRQTFATQNESYIVRYIPNHFTSRIEKSGFETVLVLHHTEVAPGEITVLETQEPMWEEIVHDHNLYNDYTPAYHYQIQSAATLIKLSKRWLHYQTLRLKHLRKLILIDPHEVH